MLNVNRLRILREVAERGTIAAAAEVLWITPPAVSQQLASLERETGVKLLEKDGRRVRLTEAARRLVADSERVFAALEETEAALKAATKGVAGRLQVSAFPTAARSMLVPVLVTMLEEHPRLRVTMVDLEPEESLPALKTGQLDLVVTYHWDVLPDIEDAGIEREQLLVEPTYLALPKSHPSAGGPVRLKDFADAQWIVGRDSTSMIDLVVAAANRAGYQPKTDLHSMDFQVILAAVNAGLGVALVPPLALIADYPNVAFQPIADMPLHRRIHASIRRGSGADPAIAAVLAQLRAVSAGLQAELRKPPRSGGDDRRSAARKGKPRKA